MKLKILTLALILSLPSFVLAQKKVNERDVIGTWKLIIKMDEDDDEDEEDYENRDVDGSFLGHVLSSGVKALVENILEDIDIRFEFLKSGRLEVYAMGEREDEEDTRWRINSKGELVIYDDDPDDEDDVWLMKDGKLVAYEKRGSRLKEKNVHLEKVDR